MKPDQQDLVPLDEISVAARLDEQGFSAKVTSRALGAFDRLVGNILDMANVRIGGANAVEKAKHQAQIALIEGQGEAALDAMKSYPMIGDRALANFLAGQSRKQASRDAVAKLAHHELLMLTPPEKEDDSSSEELDADWLNMFEAHAENVTTDKARLLWARILAGEIRKPGTFSLSALKVLAVMDQSIATKFQAIVDRVFHNNGIALPSELKGEFYDDLLLLEEVGLVHHKSGNHKFFDINPNGIGIIPVRSKKAIVFKGPPGYELDVQCAFLTHVGEQLAKIISHEDEVNTISDIVRVIDRRSLEYISVADYTFDGVSYTVDPATLKRVWSSDEVSSNG